MITTQLCSPSSAAASPTSPVLPSPLYWAAGILSDNTIATNPVTAATTEEEMEMSKESQKQPCHLPKTTREIIAAGDSEVHWFTKGHSPLYIPTSISGEEF